MTHAYFFSLKWPHLYPLCVPAAGGCTEPLKEEDDEYDEAIKKKRELEQDEEAQRKQLGLDTSTASERTESR